MSTLAQNLDIYEFCKIIKRVVIPPKKIEQYLDSLNKRDRPSAWATIQVVTILTDEFVDYFKDEMDWGRFYFERFYMIKRILEKEDDTNFVKSLRPRLLTEEFLTKHFDKFNWSSAYIETYEYLSNNFILKHSDRLHKYRMTDSQREYIKEMKQN